MTDPRRAALYRSLADLDEQRARVLRELAAAYDGEAANDEPAEPPPPRLTREEIAERTQRSLARAGVYARRAAR